MTGGSPARAINGRQFSDGIPNESSSRYFTDFTKKKAALYIVAALYVVSIFVLSLIEPWLTIPCPDEMQQVYAKFENPGYAMDPCSQIRYSSLLWLTRKECSFARRLVAALFLGGVIGWERRQADRPAGIRTMSLVSLGSCLFTINSAFAFIDGPMNWDASRISAAIPSGVGFLGAGLIFKKEDEETKMNIVHGLTTAASVWLSAAVGIACGGELYIPGTFVTALAILIMRFGPHHTPDATVEEDPTFHPGIGSLKASLNGVAVDYDGYDNESERTPLAGHSEYGSAKDIPWNDAAMSIRSMRSSIRSRASMAYDM